MGTPPIAAKRSPAYFQAMGTSQNEKALTFGDLIESGCRACGKRWARGIIRLRGFRREHGEAEPGCFPKRSPGGRIRATRALWCLVVPLAGCNVGRSRHRLAAIPRANDRWNFSRSHPHELVHRRSSGGLDEPELDERVQFVRGQPGPGVHSVSRKTTAAAIFSNTAWRWMGRPARIFGRCQSAMLPGIRVRLTTAAMARLPAIRAMARAPPLPSRAVAFMCCRRVCPWSA